MNRRIFSLAILAICVLLAIFLLWNSTRAPQGASLGDPFGAPFELVAHDGTPITEDAFRGHPSIVFFGFTHCPEVCPTTLYEMDGWLTSLGKDGKDIRAYFITVDPERDTPKVLGDYVTAVSDRVTGISGEPARVEAMYKSFRIFARKVPADDGNYNMDHTASVLMLDSQGRLFGTIAYGEVSDSALQKLRRLAAS
jgi:protein SCO1/2